ncbi:LPS export ABC transporter periplasmic protein LptC [Marichromatium bheemlicum]|uniref:LPS export ABC transporter periplasmic protein LptC n=1 Tax=Marichromatium bheemlicum TaxID=365339 RepID=A0ABX1I988_9GAMM|nr:LPS export ABC transporter periplasmic protein LptC [Marichromatium bheemlicum]NKN33843.1 LPS export ABC transporter periplasmic protein LptC [Marichromatium bheemlicum]
MSSRAHWPRRYYLLAAFFALSGLAGWWQLQRVDLPENPTAERPRFPDYVVHDFTALETDASGAPSRRLSAAELRQFVAEDLSELDHPRMRLFQSDGPPWRVRAKHGLVLGGGEEVRLIGAVELDRDATADAPPTHIETEQLNVWHQRAYARTDLPVQVASGEDWLSASGMQLWYDEPARATFHGRTRMLLVPSQETQP